MKALFKIGDEVVTMAAPGKFRVVSVDEVVVTIENDQGVRKSVLESNLRPLAAPKDR